MKTITNYLKQKYPDLPSNWHVYSIRMIHAEFIELVAQMRAVQKNYFKTRSKDVLLESKNLERQVDAAIAQLCKKEKEEITSEK